MKCAAVVIALTVLGCATAGANSWQTGSGASCSVACQPHGGAVQTGIWKGDPNHAFFVCRTNVNSEGARPGYNLNAAYGANRCVVPYGGQEHPSANYSCLCNQ